MKQAGNIPTTPTLPHEEEEEEKKTRTFHLISTSFLALTSIKSNETLLCAGVHASTTIQLSAGLSNTIARTNFKRCENDEKCRTFSQFKWAIQYVYSLKLATFIFGRATERRKKPTTMWMCVCYFFCGRCMLLPHFGLIIFRKFVWCDTKLCFDYSTENRFQFLNEQISNVIIEYLMGITKIHSHNEMMPAAKWRLN